jgi:hypothetical protein
VNPLNRSLGISQAHLISQDRRVSSELALFVTTGIIGAVL